MKKELNKFDTGKKSSFFFEIENTIHSNILQSNAFYFSVIFFRLLFSLEYVKSTKPRFCGFGIKEKNLRLEKGIFYRFGQETEKKLLFCNKSYHVIVICTLKQFILYSLYPFGRVKWSYRLVDNFLKIF